MSTWFHKTHAEARRVLDMDAADIASLPAIWRYTSALFRFFWRVLSRFVDDHCIQRASALGYATLLAIVPLLVLAFSVFAGFQVFESYADKMTDWVLQNFVATSQDTLKVYLGSVTDKTGALSAFGIIGLLFTITALLNTVEEAFNDIWRVTKARPLLTKFFIFWSLLTLSPILMGASISITSYFAALPVFQGVAEGASTLQHIPFVVPWLISTAAMTTLYKLLPNTNVPFFHAIVGGMVAGALFETSKFGFTFYVTEIADYKKVYGALGTLPVFLLWLYLVWVVVLIGAEVAFCSQHPEKSKRHGAWLLRPGVRNFYQHLILLRAAQAFDQGQALTIKMIAEETKLGNSMLRIWFEELAEKGLLHRLAEPENEWIVAKSSATLHLYAIHHTLNGTSMEIPENYVNTALGHTLSGVHSRMQRQQAEYLGDITLQQLVQKEQADYSERGDINAKPS
ncbi:MAG: YihY family inner membrane protein [Mariprofundaceae bacterium]|nr:YihY family inner membrane protein [Mariprofundaceae bacterium]